MLMQERPGANDGVMPMAERAMVAPRPALDEIDNLRQPTEESRRAKMQIDELARLRAYIQSQQDIASRLEDLLEGVAALRNDRLAPAAQDAIIEIAKELAGELNSNLDSVNLPKTEDAA